MGVGSDFQSRVQPYRELAEEVFPHLAVQPKAIEAFVTEGAVRV